MKKHEGDGYWLPRAHEKYYKQVREWLNEFSPGGSYLDVGGHDTPVCAWGDFDNRFAVTQKNVVNRLPHVDYSIMDFMDFDPSARFDVVSCLEVLEHLEDDVVAKFARKLFSHSTLATIISVPHVWKADQCVSHLQDPVNKEKFLSWVGREPDDLVIVKQRTGRGVALNHIVARFFKNSPLNPNSKD